MGKTLEYQGYTIQSSPHHQADGEKWQLRIFVSVDDHRSVKTREFSADVLYATEQEADIHGIAFGQRLIDGKVDGQSVVDMKVVDRRATPRLPRLPECAEKPVGQSSGRRRASALAWSPQRRLAHQAQIEIAVLLPVGFGGAVVLPCESVAGPQRVAGLRPPEKDPPQHS